MLASYAPASMILQLCGHMCACLGCNGLLAGLPCPMCRRDLSSSMAAKLMLRASMRHLCPVIGDTICDNQTPININGLHQVVGQWVLHVPLQCCVRFIVQIHPHSFEMCTCHIALLCYAMELGSQYLPLSTLSIAGCFHQCFSGQYSKARCESNSFTIIHEQSRRHAGSKNST